MKLVAFTMKFLNKMLYTLKPIKTQREAGMSNDLLRLLNSEKEFFSEALADQRNLTDAQKSQFRSETVNQR